jgi:EAL and modified HD-GYP domain-containing signal transduction protein
MQHVFVGRQPIYNRELEVVAYELLFRSGESNQAGCVDGDQATSQVIHNTFVEIGLDTIVGEKLAFINFTRGFILQDYAAVFPAHRVVIEVLEDIAVDAKLLTAIRALSVQGYTIALDDFVFRDHLRPLVELADIVKVDILALDRPTLQDNAARLRQYNVKLLAEKVETRDDFDFCRHLGFDYFQGYFLCHPDIVKGQRSPANRLSVLRLLAKLQAPEIEFDELEAMISQDVVLSYKLLRLINAAIYGLPKKVESIRQALLLLGTRFITAWVSLITLTGIDDKPRELMVTALLRGKMCELLAQAMQLPGKDIYFTIGLFSVLDAILDLPMSEVLKPLPLAEDISHALLSHEGIMGQTLHCVIAYERGQWDAVTCHELDRGVIKDAYLQAIAWAATVSDELAAT